MDEALNVRWIGHYFFFSFEMSYRREPPKPIRVGLLKGWRSGLTKLLQCPGSLCRMVERGLESLVAQSQCIGQRLPVTSSTRREL